jgi:ribosomal 50S subunit-associated protein YjgA (DUF615 family)
VQLVEALQLLAQAVRQESVDQLVAALAAQVQHDSCAGQQVAALRTLTQAAQQELVARQESVVPVQKLHAMPDAHTQKFQRLAMANLVSIAVWAQHVALFEVAEPLQQSELFLQHAH